MSYYTTKCCEQHDDVQSDVKASKGGVGEGGGAGPALYFWTLPVTLPISIILTL